MKIVGFNTKEGLRLGVVEGEVVIDLQAVDKNVPSDLGEWLRRNNGDLTPIRALAERAPFNARRPLEGLAYAFRWRGPARSSALVSTTLSTSRRRSSATMPQNFRPFSCAARVRCSRTVIRSFARW